MRFVPVVFSMSISHHWNLRFWFCWKDISRLNFNSKLGSFFFQVRNHIPNLEVSQKLEKNFLTRLKTAKGHDCPSKRKKFIKQKYGTVWCFKSTKSEWWCMICRMYTTKILPEMFWIASFGIQFINRLEIHSHHVLNFAEYFPTSPVHYAKRAIFASFGKYCPRRQFFLLRRQKTFTLFGSRCSGVLGNVVLSTH